MPQGTQYRKHFRVTPADGKGSQGVYPPTPTRHWLRATRDLRGGDDTLELLDYPIPGAELAWAARESPQAMMAEGNHAGA